MKCNRVIIRGILVTVLTAIVLSSCHDGFELEENVAPYLGAMSPFTRASIEDAMTIEDFRRSYGVGFSYDGIWGERCNLMDVRCRVLDLEALNAVGNEIEEKLFNSTTSHEARINCTTALSRSQYKQRTSFFADVNAHLLVFNGAYQGIIDVWEEGETNDFYCDVSYIAPSINMDIQETSVSTLIKKLNRTELLTPNFLDAIDWMDKHRDNATIDSFLVCYGSHIVTQASVGGVIDIHMTMKQDSLKDVYSNIQLGEATVALIMNTSTSSQNYINELNLLNNSDCSINIKGGDLSKIPNELMHFRFADRPNLSKYIDDWQSSLNYNPQDYAHNNLEMTDMTITPIWDFIPNKDVARLVRLRVEGTANELIDQAGYQNYCNTCFDLPQNVTCRIGNQTITFQEPPIANVIASGRYVASICHEKIDLPEIGIREVQVVYPIYNRQVNLRCGYTTYGDNAYSVCWLQDKCHVERDTLNTPSADGTIYMTYGVPGSVKFSNVNYQPSHIVIGYEWPMAIAQNGGINSTSPYYLTYKSGKDFLLRTTDGQEQEGNLSGLPNWSYVNKRMVRNKEYYYYWNPNEVNYK